MQKIFIDAGFYVGKALEYYAPFIDNSWTVYAFEPNPGLDVETSAERFPFKIEFIRKAAWLHDGKVGFRLSGRTDAPHIDRIRASTDEKITVPCIDFSKFVADLPPDAIIICSMDIEGAEFLVLRKMLEEKTIKRLTLLDVEFHHRLMPKEEGIDAAFLRRKIEEQGVLVKLKLEL